MRTAARQLKEGRIAFIGRPVYSTGKMHDGFLLYDKSYDSKIECLISGTKSGRHPLSPALTSYRQEMLAHSHRMMYYNHEVI